MEDKKEEDNLKEMCVVRKMDELLTCKAVVAEKDTDTVRDLERERKNIHK